MAMSENKGRLLRQVVEFGLVGVLNTVISYAIYAIALALGFHYLVGSIAGYVISVLHAWCWQYFIVFKGERERSETKWWASLLKTYASYALTGLVLNNILLVCLLDVAHVEFVVEPLFAEGDLFFFTSARQFAEYVAPIVVLLVTVPINFVMNKFWAFGRGSKREA